MFVLGDNAAAVSSRGSHIQTLWNRVGISHMDGWRRPAESTGTPYAEVLPAASIRWARGQVLWRAAETSSPFELYAVDGGLMGVQTQHGAELGWIRIRTCRLNGVVQKTDSCCRQIIGPQ